MCECKWPQRVSVWIFVLIVMMGSGGCASFDSGLKVEMSCGELARYWSYISTFGYGAVDPGPGFFELGAVRELTVIGVDHRSHDSVRILEDSTIYEFQDGWLRRRTHYEFGIPRFRVSWLYDTSACRVLIDSTAYFSGKSEQHFRDTLTLDEVNASVEGGWWGPSRKLLRYKEGSLVYGDDGPGATGYERYLFFDSAMRLNCQIAFSDGDVSSIGKRHGDIYVYSYNDNDNGCTPDVSVVAYRAIGSVVESYPYIGFELFDSESDSDAAIDSLHLRMLEKPIDCGCTDIEVDIKALADSVRATHYPRWGYTYRFEWTYW